MSIKGVFKRFAAKIIAVDNTVIPEEQIEILKDLLAKYEFDLEVESLPDFMKNIKRKHFIDSVTVTKKDGNILLSSEGDGIKEGISGAALFNYISSEMPNSNSILIRRNNDWFMAMPFNEKIYLVKAGNSLSTIELKAIAKDLEQRI